MSFGHHVLSVALLLSITGYSVSSEETEQLSEVHDESRGYLQPQKRSAAILSPEMASEDMLLGESRMDDMPYFLNDDDEAAADKRSSLFRFGKRGGTLFRFGKRGSLFRFGKRGSLLRFGKRGGTLFRFGRSGPSSPSAADLDEKRTLFRFGKRSDADLLREAMISQYEYPEFSAQKRGVHGFHWGQEEE